MKKCRIVEIIIMGLISFNMNVFATEKLNVIDIPSRYPNNLIYSDHRMYNLIDKSIYENVSKYVTYSLIENYPRYLTTDKRLVFVYRSKSDTSNLSLTFTINNVVDSMSFKFSDYNDEFIFYLTDDNKLYTIDSYMDEDSNKEPKLVMEDVVKIYYPTNRRNNDVLYVKTINNELYVFGKNYYGVGVNEGVDFTNFYKLFDDVDEFNECYVLTNAGDLYFLGTVGNEVRRPTLLKSGVDKIIDYTENYIYYLDEVNAGVGTWGYRIYVLNRDDTESVVSTCVLNNKVISYIENIDFKVKKSLGNYVLDENGNLYQAIIPKEINHVDSKIYALIQKYVEDFVSTESYCYFLKNNGELYYRSGNSSQYANDFANALLKLSSYQGNYKLLNNVDNISFLKNLNTIILKDGSVLRFGNNIVPKTMVPVKLNELNNNNNPIEPLDIVLSEVDKTEFKVGENIEYSATVIPFNATNREYTFKSNNSNVVSVDNLGNIKAQKPGFATLCAISKSNSIIKACQKIKVYSDFSDNVKYDFGDVSEDGQVDLVDVMYALRISLGLIQNTPDEVIEIGDINGTGLIDLADVMYILRIALNLR